MRSTLRITALMAVLPFISVLAATQDTFRCATPNQMDPVAQSMLSIQREGIPNFFHATVPVYFHMIWNNTANQASYNWVTQRTYEDQIAVLNTAFQPAGFEFVLQEVTHTVNADWSGSLYSPIHDYNMRRALHRGDYTTLNVYFKEDSCILYEGHVAGVLGKAEFSLPNYDFDELAMDGVMVCINVMPGGPDPMSNLGMTAVHEVGHWLGLWHTFNSYNCEDDGDEVADTTPQSFPSLWTTPEQGCPTTSDSCPDSPGVDNWDNYMDYSSDFCLSHFTNGQMERMRNAWKWLRKGEIYPF